MASYSILITSAPSTSDSAYQATKFCRELIQANHTVDQIFFYQDGVYHANCLMASPSDERNSYQAWTKLAEDFAVPLIVCATAAIRRGILSKQEAASLDESSYNLKAPFTDTGLGEFFTLLHQSDNLVQF